MAQDDLASTQNANIFASRQEGVSNECRVRIFGYIAAMQTSTLPEHPRLHAGVCMFESESSLVVRSVAGALRVDAVRCAAVRRLLPKLTGAHTLQDVLLNESGFDGIYLLGLLRWLFRVGALADGPPAAASEVRKSAVRLDGFKFTIPKKGEFASALESQITAAGGVVWRDSEPTEASILVACPDYSDLALLERLNLALWSSGSSWLPVFPFGDGVIVGPLVQGGGLPCFRCFELRWLGISASVALERMYFEHVRVAPQPIINGENAAGVSMAVLPLIVKQIVSRDRSAGVTLLRLESGAISASRLLPSPRCEVCGNSRGASVPDVPVSWVDEPRSLGEIAEDVLALEGWPCGLARIWEHPDGRDDLDAGPLQVTVARYAFPTPEDVEGVQENWSHGSAATACTARTLAVMEAIERYGGLSSPPPGIWAAYKDVASEALCPLDLPLFSEGEYALARFPFKPFHPRRRLRWNWGYNVTRRRRVLVPTSAAWYGYDDELLGESSNGVAAHSSRGSALQSGVYELVERDAFMIHWLHRISPPQIVLEETRNENSLVIARWVANADYAVHVVDLTTDLGIPVALAIGVHSQGRRPALIIGAGASLDRHIALEKAFGELYSATFAPTKGWALGPALDHREVRRLEDHARAYAHPSWLQYASFLWESPRRANGWERPVPDDGGPHGFNVLTRRLADNGHDVIGVELTGSDIARHRLHVVRAIVPGLQPLALGCRGRFGGRRLFLAPVKMGHPNAAQRPECLYSAPHCFP